MSAFDELVREHTAIPWVSAAQFLVELQRPTGPPPEPVKTAAVQAGMLKIAAIVDSQAPEVAEQAVADEAMTDPNIQQALDYQQAVAEREHFAQVAQEAEQRAQMAEQQSMMAQQQAQEAAAQAQQVTDQAMMEAQQKQQAMQEAIAAKDQSLQEQMLAADKRRELVEQGEDLKAQLEQAQAVEEQQAAESQQTMEVLRQGIEAYQQNAAVNPLAEQQQAELQQAAMQEQAMVQEGGGVSEETQEETEEAQNAAMEAEQQQMQAQQAQAEEVAEAQQAPPPPDPAGAQGMGPGQQPPAAAPQIPGAAMPNPTSLGGSAKMGMDTSAFRRLAKAAMVPDTRAIGERLGVDWDRVDFSPKDLAKGMKVEKEHNAPGVDVVRSDIDTAKIALAHLAEGGDYYDRLAKMEADMKKGAEGRIRDAIRKEAAGGVYADSGVANVSVPKRQDSGNDRVAASLRALMKAHHREGGYLDHIQGQMARKQMPEDRGYDEPVKTASPISSAVGAARQGLGTAAQYGGGALGGAAVGGTAGGLASGGDPRAIAAGAAGGAALGAGGVRVGRGLMNRARVRANDAVELANTVSRGGGRQLGDAEAAQFAQQVRQRQRDLASANRQAIAEARVAEQQAARGGASGAETVQTKGEKLREAVGDVVEDARTPGFFGRVSDRLMARMGQANPQAAVR